MSKKNENVRALIRGLEILKLLNRRGAAKASEVASRLNIPRPTVYRLLHTLEEAGYVAFSATDSRVRVTPLAAALGDNSAARSLLCQVAAPIMAQFTDTYTWPVDLCIYEDMHMVVQETTHGRSALSIDRDMSGFPLPMLRSSAGRAYLATCSDQERRIILDLLRRENIIEDRPFLLDTWLETNLSQYQKQGYAMRDHRTFRPKTSSIAVPILAHDGILGSLSVIWVSKAFSVAEGAERYLAPLTEAAKNIAAEYVAP